jgi:hypothetical protein
MNDGKLYVKSTCLVCLGKKSFCFYCDAGLTYVEAADKIIKEWFSRQPEDVKKYIIGVEDESA